MTIQMSGIALTVRPLYYAQFLHQQSIAHRDIKPENVLLVRPYLSFSKTDDTLSSAPIVQLADFGLACRLDSPSIQEQITQQHSHSSLALTPCGTVCYHSPELLISAVTYQGYCPFKVSRTGSSEAMVNLQLTMLSTVRHSWICGH